MNGEILRMVDAIHRDRDIDKEVIFQGIEAALLSAVKKQLGEIETLRVEIDRDSGETKIFDEDKEIEVPEEGVGRIAATQGKQVLFQKIKEAEAEKVFAEYEAKVQKLVTGVVQRQEGPNLIVNLGRVEGILPRSEQAPGEKFRVGERIKVLVKDLKKNTNRVKITLSRTSPGLVRALFELEVPEIADKVIEIMDIVREPGYRTKIAVTTYDHNVDCVGACVGVRGSRIKNIVDELFGEKIDIVRWNESIEVLIMNGLKPAEISSMDLDFEAKRAIVYVKPDQQSLAIGKRGQNVRLASKLAKWDLDIVTVSDADLEKLRKEDVSQGDEPLTAEGLFPEGEGPEGEGAESEGESSEQDAAATETNSDTAETDAGADADSGSSAAESASTAEAPAADGDDSSGANRSDGDNSGDDPTDTAGSAATTAESAATTAESPAATAETPATTAENGGVSEEADSEEVGAPAPVSAEPEEISSQTTNEDEDETRT